MIIIIGQSSQKQEHLHKKLLYGFFIKKIYIGVPHKILKLKKIDCLYNFILNIRERKRIFVSVKQLVCEL